MKKRSSSEDRAPRPEEIQPFNNSKPARPTLARSCSLGREVRCGCQFFGTDSLLPERQALMMMGRPKAKSTMSSPKSLRSQAIIAGAIKRQNMIKSARSSSWDHEYEPVMAPPPSVRVTGPNYDRYEPELGNAPREGSNSSTESRERKERKFLRIPLDDELQGLPVDGEGSEDEAMGVEEKEDTTAGEDRAVVAPSPGTTTGSRTDLELNTSQVDSSALEDLPLSRSARRQQRLEQQNEERGPGAASRSLQRIRSQAGKLRTKLRSIKRPNINMPERPRFSMPERPKFNLPERPKFLTERPKFLTERPKINITRPKFNLPERPKFNLPERPKFNFPERPKFNLPERPKINFPSFSMPRTSFRRPLRERQQGSTEDDPQKVHDDTPVPSTTGKRNYFDFRTYPRIFDRKSRQQASVPVRTARHRHVTPPVLNYGDDEEEMEVEEDSPVPRPKLPPRRRSSGGQQQQRWVGRFTELEYADTENHGPPPRMNGSHVPFDDDDEEEIRALERELHAGGGDTDVEDRSESISGFRDKDFGYAVSLGPTARAPQPPMIDKDDEEISLGESEREVAHSSGSSSDRRRAGVLEEIDSDEFFLREKGLSQEDVAVGQYLSSEIRDALRPGQELNAVMLLENATLNEAELARSYRGTPERTGMARARPPRRPRAVRPPRGSPPLRQQEEEAVDTTQYFNTFPPNKPTRNRRRQMRQAERQRKEKAATLGRTAGPQVPKRKKRTRSDFVLDNASQWSEEQEPSHPEWLKDVEAQVVNNQETVPRGRAAAEEHEYIIPEAPAAPKRGRRTSRRTPDEDARSHISDQPDPGYATVIKPGVIEIEVVDSPQLQQGATPPPRRVKTLPRPPFPSIRRRRSRPLSGSGTTHFFTVPHRRSHHGPPTRPMRNYSTLGPARPPRRLRRRSLEDVHDASRNLQSGAVIQKMKERPLPPPPRPPRRERDTASLEGTAAPEETLQVAQEVQMAEAEPQTVPQTTEDAQEPSNAEEQRETSAPVEEEENVVIHKMELASDAIHTEQKIVPGSIMEQIISQHITAVSEPVVTAESEPVREEQLVQEEQVKEVISESQVTSDIVAEPQESEIPPAAVEVPQIEASVPVEETAAPAEVIEQPAEPVEQQEVLSEAVIVESSIQTADAASEAYLPSHEEVMTESVSTQATIYSMEASTSPAAEEQYVPVEEVSVSTQTDPLPEEELMRLVMEQEEALCAPEPCEPPVSQSVAPGPELSPSQPAVPMSDVPSSQPSAAPGPDSATAALIQALNSGQLRLELLDVARLNVNELQAQRLLVSDIDGLSLNVGELQSRGGALVLSTLDAPMGSLAEALISAAQQMAPPPPPPAPLSPPPPPHAPLSPPHPEPVAVVPVERPAPTPQAVISDQAVPVEAPVESQAMEMRESSPTEFPHESTPVPELIPISEAMSAAPERPPKQPSPQPSTSHASALPSSAYHSLSPVFTTEQVVALQAAALSREREPSLPPPLPPRRASANLWQSPQQQQQEIEPGIAELGSRLARACCTATLGALRRVVTYAEHAGEAQEQTRERGGLQVALCIVLVLVAGLILIGLGGSGAGAVHHHHWDFYMPQ